MNRSTSCRPGGQHREADGRGGRTQTRPAVLHFGWLERGAWKGRRKVELARGWRLVVEVLTPCWEQDFIQWALVSQAGLLFKWMFISMIFLFRKVTQATVRRVEER